MPTSLRSFVRVAVFAAITSGSLAALSTSGAHAQDKDKPEEQAPEQTPELQKAIELAGQGNEALKNKDYDTAIARFEEAFKLYKDAKLQLLIGEAYRLKGDATEDFDNYRRAVEYYETYVTLVPTGAEVDAAKQRITVLKEGIAKDDERKKAEADLERKKQEDDAAAEAEEKRKRDAALAERQGMQMSAKGEVVTGVSDDFTAMPRGIGGVMLNWGQLAIEANLSFDFFFRLKGDGGGLAARSLSLGVGGRYAFKNDRFHGLFATWGVSSGLMLGKPSERRLEDNEGTCMEQANVPDCSFDLDKQVAGRAGLGWGFAASPTTTVAVRVDLGYWLFSVDGEQKAIPARFVERPQDALSVNIGLEIMRWM